MPRKAEINGAPKKEQQEKELKKTRKGRVQDLREAIEKNLNVKDMKVTLADFIRLMQLERELEEDEQPREIIITWKDPSAQGRGSSK